MQAEAIPPDALTRMVRASIESRQDGEARADLLNREAEGRAELMAKLGVGND